MTEDLYKEVFGLCLSILRNKADAEDATQNTFLIMHKRGLIGKSWLMMVARRCALLVIRAKKRQVKAGEFPEPTYTPVEVPEVEFYLDQLKPELQQIIQDRYYRELPYVDIATLRGVSIQVTKRKHREAIFELQTLIKTDGPILDHKRYYAPVLRRRE